MSNEPILHESHIGSTVCRWIGRQGQSDSADRYTPNAVIDVLRHDQNIECRTERQKKTDNLLYG